MNYTFTTELFGLIVEVEGVFEAGEPQTWDCPGEPPHFEIEKIVHKGEELEIDSLPPYELETICSEAFDKVEEERY